MMQGEGQPFNGDTFMEAEFLRLKEKHGITHVIETGTYHGDTTIWLAKNFDRVVTIESNTQHRDIALKNLSVAGYYPSKSVTPYLGDSSTLLFSAIEIWCASEERGSLLIFLDAHWYKNPVLKELEQIAESGIVPPVLVIHDFKVPDRPEFGYDEYPNEKIVYEWSWIESRIEAIYGKDGYAYHYNLEATGAKRGCVFIEPIVTG